MTYLGDFVEDASVVFGFTTNAADGGRESFSATLEEADIVIFKDGTAMTLDASTITISNDIGSRVGVHIITVDMSNDADFTTGADYVAILYASDETLDSQAPAGVLAHWSCENRTVDARAISGSATAADNLEASALGIIPGTAQTGTLSTTSMTSNLTGYLDDELIGRVVVWTSGTATGQASTITDYASTNGQVTYDAITTAPANNDTFVIV